MHTETIGFEHYAFLAIWLALPVLLFVAFNGRRRLGGFLLLTYVIALIMTHWFGALAHVSPESPFVDSTETIIGFRISTYALLAVAAGAALISLVRRPRRPAVMAHSPDRYDLELASMERIARRGLIPFGALSWLLTSTPVIELPSATAILSVGKQALLLGICLICWSAWRQARWQSFYLWLAAAGVLPIVTIVTSGFISYGMMMLTTVLVFVAIFYRPRWRLLAGFLILLYAGVSLWVSYAAQRSEVRAAVWGGAGVVAVLGRIADIATSVEPFDLYNPEHLVFLDLRLNQNQLVGAVLRHTPEYVPFRNGETIYGALAAVIPRAIWPDKPEIGGSGDYVSEHSLIEFAEGTSIGMGQVIEFYINFGLPGVIFGFMALGALLRYLDIRLAEYLMRDDWIGVMFIFFIGAGLLQAQGALSEMTSSAVAGIAGAYALKYALSTLQKRSPAPVASHSRPVLRHDPKPLSARALPPTP